MTTMRFALYYTPQPFSLLSEIGCKWLGRDALAQKRIEQDHFTGIKRYRIAEITRIPRRYGLHATLKAPFSLATDRNEDELRSAINEFAAGWHPFSTSPLVLRQINDFFCLCPETQSSRLDTLAKACVQKFDSFRAPLTRLELAHRRAEILTDFQKQNLANWGYPHVLNEYRFHITLTGKIIDISEKNIIRSLLLDVFAPVLGKPLVIESVCLFVEPANGQPFV
ncbi:MAG TPA: DUF1045 domain-containing protein, partial [Desulfobacterales bacterium]|nr:DUF1045 domain-containing protein [Desulfobacterales bacterium]